MAVFSNHSSGGGKKMKINQQVTLTYNKETEYVVIPYLQEEGIKKEWLKLLLPTLKDEFPMEAFIQEKSKPVIYMQESWVQLEFLPIEKEQVNPIEDIRKAFSAFAKQSTSDCQLVLDHLHIEGVTQEELIQIAVQALFEGAYHFNKRALTQVRDTNIFSMRGQLTDEKTQTITLVVSKSCKEAITKGMTYGQAINRARTIANIPNNYLHVKEFAAYARQLAAHYGLACTVLGNEELKANGCGGILSVNAGSEQEANLIVLSYHGDEKAERNAVIGKGVMFDAGGYHLKSLEGMDGMKYDMCGAANVLAVIEIVAALKSKTNLMVVIPAVENVISPDATKMGDVITTMSGKTVEIWNTDAEGRLILCDALTYAIRQGATKLIDVATLTYSCQGALGSEISGIFSNCEDFYKVFLKHANKTGEKVWRLPLDAIYHKLLKNTKTADLMNYAPGYAAGASVAACFLEEFIENDLPWIHLDVVGTAVCRSEGVHKEKGATGVLISTITSYLEQGAKA